MKEDRDLHDKMIFAFIDYFNSLELWEKQKHSWRTYYVLRQKTKELARITKERHNEVLNIQNTRKRKPKEASDE